MRDFGFTAGMLHRIIQVPYFRHNPSDIYDPEHPTLGNTNV
jgi:hypothetical protein